MIIKLTKGYLEHSINDILEVEDLLAKDLIQKDIGIEYTAQIESKEKIEIKEYIQEAIKKEIYNMEQEIKKTEDKVEIVVKDNGQNGFKNGAEYLEAVKKAAFGKFDPRLEMKAATGLGEFATGAGAELVTPSFISDVIYKQMMEEAVILPKCAKHVLAENASATTLIKQVNETLRSNTSTFGGLRVYKVDEGDSITPSIPAFKQKSVTLSKAAVLSYISEEAMRDIVNIVPQTADMVSKSLAFQLDNDIVNGDLGIFTPIVGDLATVVSGISATPTAAEILAIYNKILPSARGNAEWFMGPDVYAKIMNLQAPVTTSGGSYPLYSRNIADPDKETLLGKPMHVVEWAKAGQLLFADLSNYAVVSKEGLQAAMSIHVAFLSAQNVYRWYIRLAGAPLIASKITLPSGIVVSPFVSSL